LNVPLPLEKPYDNNGSRRDQAQNSLEAVNTMTSIFVRSALGLALAMAAPAAFAQESTNRVATKTDWSVFTEESPKECWGVSSPKQSVNSRDGQPVSVRRGDILLFVTFRPGAGAAGEVSFTGGYPFAPGSTIKVEIDGQSYDLFADGEWAWPASAEADQALLAAMKRGAEAVLTGASGRGTQTQDTFSLRGFTAAMQEAETRCQ
jgi:invasion protein IalB